MMEDIIFPALVNNQNIPGWYALSGLLDFQWKLDLDEALIRVGLPSLLLVLASWQTFSLRSLETRARTRRSRWILCGKITFLTCASVCSLASLIILVSIRTTPSSVLPYACELAALVSSIFFTSVNHTRTRRSSSLLLLFWPLYSVGIILWAYDIFSRDLPYRVPLFGLRCAVGSFGLASFALECLSPEFGCDKGTGESNVENPILTANIFSIWSFGWMTPLMRKGALQYITQDDLPPLLARDESAKLSDDLQNALAKHSSLWTSLFSAYGEQYLVAAGLKIIQDFLVFLQPQLLRWLLAYISIYQAAYHSPMPGDPATGPTAMEGFAIAIIMFVAAVIQSVILNQYFQRCYETGMRVRAGLVTAIYKKALVLSNDERAARASGDIVNLQSVDATRIQDLCTYGLIAISGPLQITLAFVSLYNLLGWAAFIGVAIMIISIPLQTLIAQQLKKLQEKQMKNRDKRTRLMSELLANIKSIKLYAWEFAFIRRVLFVRNEQEVKMLRTIGVVTALNTTLWSGIPLLVAFSSFATAAVTNSKPLTSDIIFPAISLFMLLQFPFAMFAQVTSNIIESIVYVQRISQFLKADELQPGARNLAVKTLRDGDEVLSIANGEFSWSKQAVVPTLENVNLTVKKGELWGIFGRVGAGKTSLLSAIVGEMVKSEGTVTLSGCVSYAPQNPWILSASIRSNILFSHEYDESFYNLVLDACALRQDLAVLPQGDLTEVGEKGITLSGGQRARVSLARAVYARADLILLDDVLAAVDAHVARHVFDHVIGPHGLLATKARILVTNSISFLKYFDKLAYIRRGMIIESGSVMALMSDPQSQLSKLVRDYRGGGNSSGTNTPFITSGSATPKVDEDNNIITALDNSDMFIDAASLTRTLSATAIASPRVYTREEWGARHPTQQATIISAPDHIVVHCGTSVNTTDYSLEAAFKHSRNVQSLHMDTHGWADCGHQLTVSRGGFVMEGRNRTLEALDLGKSVMTTQASEENGNAFEIEIEGTYDNEKLPVAQYNALVQTLAWLCDVYGLDPQTSIIGHHNSKAAESLNTEFYERLPELRQDVSSMRGTIVSEKLKRRASFSKAALAEISLSSTAATKEHSEQGRVKRNVYVQYIKAASRAGFFGFLLAVIAQQAVNILANLTLRDWGEHNRNSGGNSGMGRYLLAYGLFSLSSTLLGAAGSILMWVLCALRSAKYLHDSMLNAVMRAPLSFFELTPTGRILNLFSRDTYVVDQILARVIQNLVRTMAVCLFIVAVIGFSFPPFLIAVFPLGYFYIRVMKYYLATSRELKRLDAVSRSPIFSWFSESLAGLSTIRAFNQQSVFVAKNALNIDRNQKCYIPSINVNRWLALRLEFVGAVIIFISACLAVTALVTTGIDGGLVGLVLSYALSTTGALNWVVRSASEVEQNVVSVERILHYVQTPPEAPYEIETTKPSDLWPSNGEVEFRDYSTRYREQLDLVLKDVSMTIKPREKVGVCGRTGAGKSSLLLALFRIIEPAGGTIHIDGVDITTIGLHNLRSVISIVPQQPDLFEGTIRENIDPIGEHQDVDIWIALGQSYLKEYVESLPGGLDAPVSEGGSSLSSGQRQLLCFARALLRKSKILVLDEATSAVDLETDSNIQDIIRGPSFEQCTMFTIAHRLNTIMESDRILVLDNGMVAELDTPENLLADKGSIFYSLAAEAGLVSNASNFA